MMSSAGPPGTSSHLEESLKGLNDEVKLFRRHSRRMSQVAAYAAQSSADSKRTNDSIIIIASMQIDVGLHTLM